MALSYRLQFLQLLASNEHLLDRDFETLAEQIRARLLASDDREGNIPPSRWQQVEAQVVAIILTYFLAATPNGGFTLSADGTLTPQSLYLRLLWGSTQRAAEQAVDQQAAILRRGLRGEPQLVNQLRSAVRDPFASLDRLPTNAQRVLSAHRAPYEREVGGRTLADRVIRTAGETARKVRLLLREQLASGIPARQIAATMERFLTGKIPDKHRPYGTTARFDAARLLRGETTTTYGAVGLSAAALNPFVTEVDWVVSARHKEIDLCDQHAAGSPYALDAVPPFPGHGNCLCYLRYRVHRQTKAMVEALRGSELLRVRGVLSPGFAEFLLRSSGVNA